MPMLLRSLNSLFSFLAKYPQYHSRESSFYGFVDDVVRQAFLEAKETFCAAQPIPLAEFGSVVLPYEKMGAIDSIDLFGLDELLMFAYYLSNKDKYRTVADIGANIGLHSILLSKAGFNVKAYEPDPRHYATLVRNLELNGISDCEAIMAGVSDKDGAMDFVRVLGNTTSSHLAGAKLRPYGDLERFPVQVRDVREVVAGVDLMKVDAEGHEGVILRALPIDVWDRLDAFVEIGTVDNALSLFEHFRMSRVRIFTQKLGWQRAERLEQLPTSYKEGGAFITTKDAMNW